MAPKPTPSDVPGYARVISVRPVPSSVPSPKKSRVSISGPGNRPAATPFIGNGAKKLTFGSEWHFKIDGIKTVQQRFGNRTDAHCYYDSDDFVWQILCVPAIASQVESFFVKLLRNLINEELLDRYESESDDEEGDVAYDSEDPDSEPKKSTKLIRLSVWKRLNGLSETNAIEAAIEPLPVAISIPAALEHYEAQTSWGPGASSELLVSDLFPYYVIQQLQDLTGCVCVLDIGQNKVFIGAHSEEQCHRAVGKMDNIRDYAQYADMKGRPVRHVLYTERHEKVRYQIKTFTGVNHKFFLATLLDNMQWCSGNDYDNLWQACTIRLAPWNHLSHPAGFELYRAPQNQAPATPQDQVDAGSRIFGPDFTFISKTPEQNPMSHIEQLEAQYASIAVANSERHSNDSFCEDHDSTQLTAASAAEGRFSGWLKAEDRAPDDVVDNSEHSKENGRLLGSAAVAEPSATRPKPVWDTYTEVDPPKQADQSKRLLASTAPTSLFARNIAVINQGDSIVNRSSSSELLRARTYLAPVIQQGLPPTSRATAAISSNTIARSASTQQLVPAVRPPSASVTDVEEFLNPRPETTLLDSDDLSVYERAFPALEPTRVSAHGQRSHGHQNTSQPQTERLQENSEASTRVFHLTMNQGAPSRGAKNRGAKKQHNPFEGRLEQPTPPRVRQHIDNSIRSSGANVILTIPSAAQVISTEAVADPIPELCIDINIELDNIMSGVRGFCGEVLLHAEFGRTILKRVSNQQIANEKNPQLLLDKESLLSVLQPQNRHSDAVYCHPFFSRVLTTAAPDATVLVDMKDSKGNKIWGTQLDWEIMYQFLGRNTAALGHPPFIIEMDGEKNDFKVTIKKQRPLGEIYVHGTKRNWDFRISAVGNESFEKTYADTYSPLANGIRDTLYIPEKLSKPFLAFSLPDSVVGTDKMEIDSVRVHRISNYLSVDEKSVLRISEITDLDISQISAPAKGLTVFKAVKPPEYRPGREKVNTWFEVNISSVAAHKFLRQNETLELGDKAGWTVESLSKANVAEALYLPAFEMLKQMDGIGFWNDNDVDPNYRPIEKEMQEEPRNFQWW